MAPSDTSVQRCDFCRLPCPVDPVTAVYDDVTYEFCSPSCREALTSSERVFTEYHGHRRFQAGVTGIDAALPEGMPRDSFVLLSGQSGTRDAAVQAELVWRTLERGESALIVSFLEPPVSVVGNFVKMEWNVLPYLDRGDLRILDCFAYRRDGRGHHPAGVNDWNDHLANALAGATTPVRDPSDTSELANKLEGVLEEEGMVESGAVVVDSLTEFGSLLQPVQAYDFVKSVRADVCKGRYVPVFAGATFGGDGETFPHDLDYVADGVVDMELNGAIVEDTLLKRVRVRKMDGVLTIPEWRAYEYTARLGMVTFDPDEERDDEADGDGTGTGDDAPDSSAGGPGDDGATPAE